MINLASSYQKLANAFNLDTVKAHWNRNRPWAFIKSMFLTIWTYLSREPFIFQAFYNFSILEDVRTRWYTSLLFIQAMKKGKQNNMKIVKLEASESNSQMIISLPKAQKR
jgi:hypothetical protein